MISNSGPGRPRGLLPWGSHRSVRALSGIRLVTSWVRRTAPSYPPPLVPSCYRCVSCTRSGFNAPAMFPSNGSMTWHPLLSTGSLGVVPRFNDTMGRSDSLPPFPARFVSFTSRYHRVARGSLPWPGASDRRPGSFGSGFPIRIDDGNGGASQVPWKPWWSLPVLFDPGRIRQAEWTKSSCLTRPPPVSTTKAPRVM